MSLLDRFRKTELPTPPVDEYILIANWRHVAVYRGRIRSIMLTAPVDGKAKVIEFEGLIGEVEVR